LAANPEKVVVGEVPLIAAPPGVAVTVQAVEGRPLKATVPVAVAQLGWVMVPITGTDGTTGWAFITALVEDDDVHPEAVRVTVKV